MKLVVLIFCKYSQAGKCQMSRYCKYLGAALLGSCTLQIQPGADQIISRHRQFTKRTKGTDLRERCKQIKIIKVNQISIARPSAICHLFLFPWPYWSQEARRYALFCGGNGKCRQLFWYVEIYWDTIYDEVCYIFWVGKGQASIVLPECVSLLPRQAGWLPVAYWRSNNERCHSDKR